MAQRKEATSLRDKVKRRLTQFLRGKPDEKFNVLLVGMPGSGKSTFINSMIMAVTGTWWEVAHYSELDRGLTRCLEGYVMFDDNCKEPGEPHPMPGYRKNIVFWDCVGFPDADEKSYSTIVSLALDGRIPTGTDVHECMNQNPDQLRSRFSGRVDRNVTFDRIVFLIAANRNIPGNLVEAVKRGAQQGHDVPIVVLLTKIDKCTNPRELQESVESAQAALQLTGNTVRFKRTSLYCEELTPWPNPNDYRVMKPNAEIDNNLLNIWMSLTEPNIKAKPAPNPPRSWWDYCVLS
ncbi:uncharacterized protein LOC144925403 [Branchiostoma floridae x Branchiostoma belcheri]